MTMKRKFNLVIRLFAFAVIVWMLPLEAILSICYVYVSRDYMTAKDTSSWFKRFGMIILRSFIGYLVLAIVLIWAMEIQGGDNAKSAVCVHRVGAHAFRAIGYAWLHRTR